MSTTARCGCKIETESGGEYARIVYCAFHGSSSLLIAALREITEAWQVEGKGDDAWWLRLSGAMKDGEMALKATERMEEAS